MLPRDIVSHFMGLPPEDAHEAKELDRMIVEDKNTIGLTGMRLFRNLKSFKERKLYRADYDSFELYCHKRLQVSYKWVQRFMSAMDLYLDSQSLTLDTVSQVSTQLLTPKQTKILAAVAKESRAAVIEEARSNAAGRLTTKHLAEAASKVAALASDVPGKPGANVEPPDELPDDFEPPPDDIEYPDETFHADPQTEEAPAEWPPELLGIIDSGKRAFADMKGSCEQLMKAVQITMQEPWGRGFSGNNVLASLKEAHAHLKEQAPVGPCVYCDGKRECLCCNGTRWITYSTAKQAEKYRYPEYKKA